MAPKLGNVLVSFINLLADVAREDILKRLAVDLLKSTSHAMYVSPQRSILVPAQRAGSTKEVLTCGNLYQGFNKFALYSEC